MRSFAFAAAALVVCVLFGTASGASSWCLHTTTDNFRIYNLTATTLTSQNDNTARNYTMNSCYTAPCASNPTTCQICQWTRTCIAYTAGGVYSALPQNYSALYPKGGYKMTFTGDRADGCPGGRARDSTVYVLCGRDRDDFVLLGELSTCTYAFELHTTSSCTFVPPVPTLKSNGQTKTSILLQIVPDTVLNSNALSFLDKVYNVSMNGARIYSGVSENFEATNLPSTTSVFQVSGRYGNSYWSAPSDPFTVTPITTDPTVEEQLVMNINVLKSQVLQLTQMNEQIKTDLATVEQQITVDVVPIKQQVSDVSSQVSALSVKTDKLTPSSSPAASVGGWVVLGLFLGLLAGALATVVVQKYVLKMDFPALPFFSNKRRGNDQLGEYSNSILDE